MNLRDLVEVNQQGMVHSSINFTLMDNPEENLKLCQSYVFNYDHAKPTDSTIGVLNRVRLSFHSRNEANIHCMVMQYGKGKSHFGLVLANFLGKDYNSPEVQGILSQIKSSTVGHAAIGESLDSFKKNLTKPYLVLSLSGDWGGDDIRKHIFDRLLYTLNQAGLDPAPLNLCAEPLRYLEKIQASPAKEDKANHFLEQKAAQGETEYDIQSLIQLLRQRTTAVIPLIVEIYRELEDFAPNFNAEVNVTELLKAVIENYCKGDQAPFKGMLIIFDEMNYYLNFWKSNEIAAGGTALQNITNLCEEYKGVLALVSFTQIRFRTEVGSNAASRESYLKLSTRIAPKDATYEPRSSLELVIDNLLVQKTDSPDWQQFEQKHRETFSAEARHLYEGSGKRYLELGWTEQQIRQHLSAGVFPLHPYTTYLLANLSFTQDRTAIQFLRSTVTDFVASQPAEAPGLDKPNYLYATALVDSFLENYDDTAQTQYKNALQALSGSDNEEEYQVLRALFLFWASERKLQKTHENEDHEVILGHLTGLGPIRLKAALDRLTNHYRALYYNKSSKLYNFYQGANPFDLEKEIERRAEDQDSSIADVVGHAQGKLEDYLKAETLTGLRFVQEKRLVQDEWQFEQRFVSSEGLDRTLTNAHSLQKLTHKGLVLYVLADTQEELQQLQRNIVSRLEKSPVGDQIVVAIPGQETGDLDRLLLKRQLLSQMDPKERRDYGEAFTQLLNQWDQDIQRNVEQIIKTYRYFCRGMVGLTTQEQQQAHNLVSHLLAQRYPFAPPVQNIDKLRPGHTTGGKIVRFTAQKLFCNDLTDLQINGTNPKSAHKSVIEGVYCHSWGLLKYKSKQYHIQVPTNAVIREAWDLITQAADRAKAANRPLPLLDLWKILSAPPYGYSDYNFMVLLSGWLGYHHRTVLLNGRIQASGKGNIPVATQKLKDWAGTDIFSSPKDFIGQWVKTHRAMIIFRDGVEIPERPEFPASWDQAQNYLEAAEKCLKSKEIENKERLELMQGKEVVVQACQAVETWLEPIAQTEQLASSNALSPLIKLYPQLWQSPPPVDLNGKPCVTPSQKQRDRQKAAQIQIRDRLEHLLTKGTTALPTIADCDQREQQILEVQKQLETLPEQFPAFTASLDKALTQITERRKTLKHKKTTSFLEGQIQVFLDRHPQANVPLHSQEEALQELANLQTQLQNSTTIDPQQKADLTAALGDCKTQIEAQISTLNTKLEALREALVKVDDRTSFNACQRTHTELAVLYKGSSQEQASKALGDRLQKLSQDLDRLDKLQANLNTCQSIAECDRLQDKITQVTPQLNTPDQFRAGLATLQQKATAKAATWIQALETQADKLQTLTGLAEARSYQADLLALRPRYKNSAAEPTFIALLEDLTPWLDLFQILDTTPSNTLDQCQTKLKALNHWHQQQPELSPPLQDLYSSHRHDLEQDLDRFTENHKTQALDWWQQLNQESAQIATLEGSQRFKLAATIQKSLREGWAKHGRFIPDKKIESEDLYQRCSQVLDEEKIDRIKQMFLQVPRSERPQLLKDLYAMAKAETEVF